MNYIVHGISKQGRYIREEVPATVALNRAHAMRIVRESRPDADALGCRALPHAALVLDALATRPTAGRAAQ